MTDRDATQQPGDKRSSGVRLRKFIDVVVEDKLSSMLFRGAIADISQTGMRVIVDQYLAKGTSYTFTMKRFPRLSLRGEVRWIRQGQPDTFQVGVLFVDVPEEDAKRLESFIESERSRTTAPG